MSYPHTNNNKHLIRPLIYNKQKTSMLKCFYIFEKNIITLMKNLFPLVIDDEVSLVNNKKSKKSIFI